MRLHPLQILDLILELLTMVDTNRALFREDQYSEVDGAAVLDLWISLYFQIFRDL